MNCVQFLIFYYPCNILTLTFCDSLIPHSTAKTTPTELTTILVHYLFVIPSCTKQVEPHHCGKPNTRCDGNKICKKVMKPKPKSLTYSAFLRSSKSPSVFGFTSEIKTKYAEKKEIKLRLGLVVCQRLTENGLCRRQSLIKKSVWVIFGLILF